MLKSPTEYIRESVKIYTKKENFVYFAKIMALVLVVSLPLAYLLNYFNSLDYKLGIIIVSITSFIVGVWVNTVVMLSVIKMGTKESEILKLGLKKMWKYLLVTFVYGSVFITGLILLIVPGIIFGFWFAYSAYVALDKDLSLVESFKTSKAMVKGKFFPLVGRNIVIVIAILLVTIVLSVIPYLGSSLVTFVSPLFTLPFFLIYRDLRSSS